MCIGVYTPEYVSEHVFLHVHLSNSSFVLPPESDHVVNGLVFSALRGLQESVGGREISGGDEEAVQQGDQRQMRLR